MQGKKKECRKCHMSIMLSATNGPDEVFLTVLDSYIFGKITLEEMEERINRFEYLEV